MSYWFDDVPEEKTQGYGRRGGRSGGASSTSVNNRTRFSALGPSASTTTINNNSNNPTPYRLTPPYASAADIHRIHDQAHTSINRGKGRRPGGENVARRATAADLESDNLNELREHNATQRLADWHSRFNANIRTAIKRRNEKITKAELQMASQELQAMRRAQLKELLNREYQQYKKELGLLGLAIAHEELL